MIWRKNSNYELINGIAHHIFRTQIQMTNITQIQMTNIYFSISTIYGIPMFNSCKSTRFRNNQNTSGVSFSKILKWKTVPPKRQHFAYYKRWRLKINCFWYSFEICQPNWLIYFLQNKQNIQFNFTFILQESNLIKKKFKWNLKISHLV